MATKKLSNVMVLMKYFGKQIGQSLSEFKAEIDQLSTAEKAELAELARPYLETE
jgi:hypothetical protein